MQIQSFLYKNDKQCTKKLFEQGLIEWNKINPFQVSVEKNKDGYCKLSVIIACQPKNIKILENSKYSLDDYSKLPINLIKI
jgi:hypothetical protein